MINPRREPVVVWAGSAFRRRVCSGAYDAHGCAVQFVAASDPGGGVAGQSGGGGGSGAVHCVDPGFARTAAAAGVLGCCDDVVHRACPGVGPGVFDGGWFGL